MKRNTFKWRIFKYNLIVIVGLIVLAAIIFNVSVRLYIKKDIVHQLTGIAARTEETTLRQGPEYFPNDGKMPPPPQEIKFYFKLDRSLREPLSLLNADYVLLDNNKNSISPAPEGYSDISEEFLKKITEEFNNLKNPDKETYLNFEYAGMEYVAIVKPVSDKNTFGLGWIIIFSNLQKVNQLQRGINFIMFIILALSALVIALFSSLAAKKISEPFSSLNRHIGKIAERNFGVKIKIPVDDELQELVNNINIMSEKLETYDKAQKTFLQNASHEFRTPLMSIQSYAEGIKYDVVDNGSAAEIIIDETKRMTKLVEDLLYLSRLDALEESYQFNKLSLNDLVYSCIERMSVIAGKNNITINAKLPDAKLEIMADEEKLSRALLNLLSNCIRYAETTVYIAVEITTNNRYKLCISDDGPGFDAKDLPNVFDRFYKGKMGNFGLGLAIVKNITEKHKGTVTAENSDKGAMFIIDLPAIS